MTANEVKAKLIEYLPPFVDTDGEISVALFAAIATVVATFMTAVTGLVNVANTGRGVQLEADDWNMLRSGNESEASLQTLVSDRYNTQLARGTPGQIQPDVRRLSGDNTATVTLKDRSLTGWWVESTFPELTVECFVECGPLAEIDMDNKSNHPTATLQGMIRRHIVPLSCQILYQ